MMPRRSLSVYLPEALRSLRYISGRLLKRLKLARSDKSESESPSFLGDFEAFEAGSVGQVRVRVPIREMFVYLPTACDIEHEVAPLKSEHAALLSGEEQTQQCRESAPPVHQIHDVEVLSELLAAELESLFALSGSLRTQAARESAGKLNAREKEIGSMDVMASEGLFVAWSTGALLELAWKSFSTRAASMNLSEKKPKNVERTRARRSSRPPTSPK
eukprot:CAMPEP_0185597198 /NCGR_PEP_ID=MMETSP0434-20130131/81216_1 /TAXON_ID=626734 ORGANISM="Favella taraikaensis, Strain Fe Narragansett Bay" /NCGR_SAMPLE_ID=MMETSP0434 /ASSEMBLY_ACC=CAM_ASM_000379 /LENGTH=216 /DNA_ID=CAMNT_0028225859 /DNA_START=248 /DNA_END=897 /DNA_ORIENTATION=+